MTLKNLISVFSNDTRIRIESIDGVMFEGRLGESQSVDKSNLTVVWCELKDNILIISVET